MRAPLTPGLGLRATRRGPAPRRGRRGAAVGRGRPGDALAGQGTRVATAVLLAAGVGAVMAWLRFDAVNIALAVAGVLVIAVALLGPDAGREQAWPRLVDADRGGRRDEVSQLSWALTGRDGRISEAGLARLRAVAAGRLELLGLDLDADAEEVRALLGVGPYTTLHPPRTQLPTARAVGACIAALERLSPDPRSTP